VKAWTCLARLKLRSGRGQDNSNGGGQACALDGRRAVGGVGVYRAPRGRQRGRRFPFGNHLHALNIGVSQPRLSFDGQSSRQQFARGSELAQRQFAFRKGLTQQRGTGCPPRLSRQNRKGPAPDECVQETASMPCNRQDLRIMPGLRHRPRYPVEAWRRGLVKQHAVAN
jgi:hypothetical protein